MLSEIEALKAQICKIEEQYRVVQSRVIDLQVENDKLREERDLLREQVRRECLGGYLHFKM